MPPSSSLPSQHTSYSIHHYHRCRMQSGCSSFAKKNKQKPIDRSIEWTLGVLGSHTGPVLTKWLCLSSAHICLQSPLAPSFAFVLSLSIMQPSPPTPLPTSSLISVFQSLVPQWSTFFFFLAWVKVANEDVWPMSANTYTGSFSVLFPLNTSSMLW